MGGGTASSGPTSFMQAKMQQDRKAKTAMGYDQDGAASAAQK